ncbi:MAG: hypothetical protein ACREOK_10740 [Gemmatimonadaceae bacterium]
MTLVNIVTRPTTVLLLLSVAYTMLAVPEGRRLEILAMTALTSLGVGELAVTLVSLIKRAPFRVWRSMALLSAAGFAGSASYILAHSTILFMASMLLLVAGVVTARNGEVTSDDSR